MGGHMMPPLLPGVWWSSNSTVDENQQLSHIWIGQMYRDNFWWNSNLVLR